MECYPMQCNEYNQHNAMHISNAHKQCNEIHISNEYTQCIYAMHIHNANILDKLFSTGMKNVVDGDQIYNSDDDDDDKDGNTAESFILDPNTVFEIVDVGDYVGLRTPKNAIEQFYIAEMLGKGIAENNLKDQYGHCW